MVKRTPVHVGARQRRKKVDTAVRTYRHDSGRVITVVGTLHFAVRSYYDQLRALISERENGGAVVHHEGLQPVYYPEVPPTPDQEAVIASWSTQAQRHVAMLRALGWDLVGQYEALPRPESWRRVDVAAGELADLGALAYDPDLDKRIRTIERMPLWQRRLTRTAMRLQLLRGIDRLDDGNPDESKSLPGEITGHWRSLLAVRAALAEPCDVVMIWGGGHVAGIAALLVASGFTLTGTQWINALPQHIPRWAGTAQSAADPLDRALDEATTGHQS